ncbi:hypothetical protein [Kitasatospora sp. McL0602]|uniref:hypothetical protein n=1 Tax=Kitasatospora sp. McL0602 TaxID=3439530 RepID=UPI003F8C740C
MARDLAPSAANSEDSNGSLAEVFLSTRSSTSTRSSGCKAGNALPSWRRSCDQEVMERSRAAFFNASPTAAATWSTDPAGSRGGPVGTIFCFVCPCGSADVLRRAAGTASAFPLLVPSPAWTDRR